MRIDLAGKNVKVFIILSIILLIAFAGCTGKDQTIKTPDGEVQISKSLGSGPDWCKEGTKMTTTGANGEKVTYEIKGIVNFEGKEVCASGWVSNEGSTEQYFNEDHSYFVMITKDKSGKETGRQEISQPK